MTSQNENPRPDFEGERKLIINVSYKCNNHCTFCSIADRDIRHGDLEVQKAQIDEARKAGVELLDIDGGEPTLYPGLFDLLDHAVASGMGRITITSNGRMLSDAALVERLATYPLSMLISLHAPDEEGHESLTTQPGSFRQSLRGIMNALKSFQDLGVNTTLVRSNLHSLHRMAALLIKLGVGTWNIQYYTPFGKVDPALAPDPHECGNVIREVIDEFADDLRINVINLPFCFMPGYEQWVMQDAGKAVRDMLFVDGEKVNLGDFLAGRRFTNGLCLSCDYRKLCRGFWDFGEMPGSGRPWLIRMLDLIPGYACSARCRFCAVEDKLLDQAMDTEAVKEQMRRAMAFDPAIIRFGGGEPTEREDLPRLLEYARSLNIQTRSVQSHGFRLADPDYLDTLVRAGANKFNISIRGAKADIHDELTQVPGSFKLLVKAVELLAARSPELDLELDGILTRQTVDSLTEQVLFFHALGAAKFNFWFVTAEGRAGENRRDLVPLMSATAQALRKAAEMARSLGIDHFRSYYIPYCFFKGAEEIVWHPLEENARVVTPGSVFTLDQGALDLGIKPGPCDACAAKHLCFGIAASYVEDFGEGELQPYDELPAIFSKKKESY